MKALPLVGLCVVVGVGRAGIRAQDLSKAGEPEPRLQTVFQSASPARSSGCLDDNADGLLWLGLQGDYRRSVHGDIDYVTGGTISLEWELGDCNAFGMFLGGGVLELEAGSAADRLASRPSFLELGFTGRRYFTPAHVFLRPYVTAGFGILSIAWEYRTPMESGEDRVHFDSLEGLDGYAGGGLSIRLAKRLSVSAEAVAGGVAFLGKTNRELNNTAFDSFGYVGVKAEARLAF